MTLAIRSAKPGDAGLIVRFIMDLAIYEKLAHEAKATETDILRDLFGAAPKAFCDIVEWDRQPVGFALWFYTYSTFLGRPGIWLEDLFVAPAARGRGAGKALLKHLAARCAVEGLGRLEWAVLDWNQPSIDFYKSQGAMMMEDWERCRVEGDALNRLGSK